MFTGIVDHCGIITRIVPLTALPESSVRLEISSRFSDLVLGESISVDGCCLTVSHITPEGFQCEVSPETTSRTVANRYGEGTSVNLERALRLSDRLGGHLVSGHIDCRGWVQVRRQEGDFIYFEFAGDLGEDRKHLIPKGSVTVNGVSLTVNAVLEESFSVMISPHTWQKTNLGKLAVRDEVNLELDWMTKVILHGARERLRGIEEFVCKK